MINNQLSCTNTNEINEDYEQYLTDISFMKEAYNLALKADKKNETPIGCVIVHNNKIIAKGYNRRNTDNCTIKHAEISAIVAASKVLKDWRLEDCTLYVTLEPCQMCAGAIVQARIPRVVIGAMSAKSGCAGSIINILDNKDFNHQCKITYNVLEKECSELMSSFFKKMRFEKKYKKVLLKRAKLENQPAQTKQKKGNQSGQTKQKQIQQKK